MRNKPAVPPASPPDDVMPGQQQEIEMNQDYFGNSKAFREKVKRRWGDLILCSRNRPI
jgi:hypothetical protein